MNNQLKISCFLQQFYDRFFQDNCTGLAASLAYSTLLTLMPLLAVTFSILSFFPELHGLGNQISDFFISQFVVDSSGIIQKQIQLFLQQMQYMSWINISAFAIFSILMMFNIVSSFNRIWHVPMPRHFALSFVVYAVVLVISPIFIGFLFFLLPSIKSLSFLFGIDFSAFLEKPLIIISPYCIAFLVFLGFYYILPNAKVRFRHAASIALITSLIFEWAKIGFGHYIAVFSTYHVIYGALAVVPVFLLWMYFSWLIVLSGVLACHILSAKSTSE